MANDAGTQGWDDQELAEREEAASAYGVEDPDTFVDFAHSCITESEQANLEVRYLWDQCYRAYKADIDYSEKEDWQAKMTTGDMTSTVKQGVAIIRKALRQPDWYKIEAVNPDDENEKWIASFLRDASEFWFNPQHAHLDTAFSDGTELGFAIGQSHEMIPRWVPGKGLVFSLVPPWQIYRDSDASPREPWSGDYWDHVEWLDLWKVKKLGGRYVRLNEVTANESSWGQETAEKRARRKGQYYQRSSFRKAVRLIEHWGVILDKSGELLLDNARFTVAGDVLIRNPEPNPFVTMRWPGISFSPLPDLFTFEGHGVIETSLLLWLNSCNLMSLHIDDLSWRVNKLRELNRMDLEDPTDVAMFPGKTVFRRQDAPPGQPVVKEVYTSPSSNETLATLQHWDQRREASSMLTQLAAGQRGTKSQKTKGEAEILLGQSMTVFDSIGEDIEEGAVNTIRAALEVVVLNWNEYSDPSISRVMKNNPNAQKFAQMSIEQRKEMLKANCDIKIMGISAAIKNSQLIQMYQAFLKQAESSTFGKYFKPYKLLKHEVNAFGFHDPDFIMTDDQAEALDQAPPPTAGGAGLVPGALAPGEGEPTRRPLSAFEGQ